MDTMALSRAELKKYLSAMTGTDGEIALEEEGDKDLFREHWTIDVKGGKGTIRGNRPRAVLLGVYDFLRRAGCRFLRPAKAGEYIPHKALKEITVHADVTPANRHRGIVIEGAVSLENVKNIIEWAPKTGLNSYFIQFRTGYEFFERWYTHESNPFLEGEPFERSQSADFVKEIVQEIKSRDMIFHAVGHGWTTACVDNYEEGWKTAKPLTDGREKMLAMVNGKRGFYKDVPMNTHLCYSQPAVRTRMAEEVVSYAKAHPETDVLHVWLADESNNVCECDGCGKRTLSDWYVLMLNDIDRRLAAAGLKTRICFLIYLDLYWAPETERIINTDRFFLMFAPIFRSYTQPFDSGVTGERLPHAKNAVVYPHDAATYIRFLKDWKANFGGDSFDFDYHLMWDIHRDFSGERLAEVLYRDIRSLPSLGLNGFLSCQLQRAFYPNGLAFYLLGRALTEGDASFGEIREEYYKAAFGRSAPFAERLYREIGRTVSFRFLKKEESAEQALVGLREAPAVIQKALAEFPKGEDEVREESLAILRFAAENVLRFVRVLLLKLEGAPEAEIRAADEERKNFFNSNELRFQPYVDGHHSNAVWDLTLSTVEKPEI